VNNYAALIPLATNTISGETVQTTNARQLHAALEVKKDFSDWVKAQIQRGDFVENTDFLVLPQKGENPKGGRPAVEYHFTIDAGKHIAMMAGTPKGKEVRQYFIECEKAAKSKSQAPQVSDPRTAAMIESLIRLDAMEQAQKRHALEVAQLQETVAVIEARMQPENKHFTVLGYSNLVGKKIDYKTACKIGKKCANLSREQGMVIGDVRDPRFGNVHSYHESILQAVMDLEE